MKSTSIALLSLALASGAFAAKPGPELPYDATLAPAPIAARLGMSPGGRASAPASDRADAANLVDAAKRCGTLTPFVGWVSPLPTGVGEASPVLRQVVACLDPRTLAAGQAPVVLQAVGSERVTQVAGQVQPIAAFARQVLLQLGTHAAPVNAAVEASSYSVGGAQPQAAAALAPRIELAPEVDLQAMTPSTRLRLNFVPAADGATLNADSIRVKVDDRDVPAWMVRNCVRVTPNGLEADLSRLRPGTYQFQLHVADSKQREAVLNSQITLKKS